MIYRAAIVLAPLLLLSSVASAFTAESSGAQEYKDNCARCHGPEAKGNGSDANEKPGYRPADLTQIARRHGGKFPREQIYDVIDGGKRIPGHYDFDSPMPLWGLSFQIEGKQYSQESEAAVRRRIDSLLDYLESIQQK
jgi:mono/diheme cytochrome c family protein